MILITITIQIIRTTLTPIQPVIAIINNSILEIKQSHLKIADEFKKNRTESVAQH